MLNETFSVIFKHRDRVLLLKIVQNEFWSDKILTFVSFWTKKVESHFDDSSTFCLSATWTLSKTLDRVTRLKDMRKSSLAFLVMPVLPDPIILCPNQQPLQGYWYQKGLFLKNRNGQEWTYNHDFLQLANIRNYERGRTWAEVDPGDHSLLVRKGQVEFRTFLSS